MGPGFYRWTRRSSGLPNKLTSSFGFCSGSAVSPYRFSHVGRGRPNTHAGGYPKAPRFGTPNVLSGRTATPPCRRKVVPRRALVPRPARGQRGPQSCAQFCAHHRTLLSVTERNKPPSSRVKASSGAALEHSVTFSNEGSQVVDCSCNNGYEPEGREFESLRAHHSSPAVVSPERLPPNAQAVWRDRCDFRIPVIYWEIGSSPCSAPQTLLPWTPVRARSDRCSTGCRTSG